MVIVTRKIGQRLRIGDHIIVAVVEIDRGQCRLGIEAPRDVAILREEIVEPKADQPGSST